MCFCHFSGYYPPLPGGRSKAAAGEGREPGQFQTLAPVALEAKRIKTTEWAEIEAKVIELFDLTAVHLPTRKVGLSWRYVLSRESKAVGTQGSSTQPTT